MLLGCSIDRLAPSCLPQKMRASISEAMEDTFTTLANHQSIPASESSDISPHTQLSKNRNKSPSVCSGTVSTQAPKEPYPSREHQSSDRQRKKRGVSLWMGTWWATQPTIKSSAAEGLRSEDTPSASITDDARSYMSGKSANGLLSNGPARTVTRTLAERTKGIMSALGASPSPTPQILSEAPRHRSRAPSTSSRISVISTSSSPVQAIKPATVPFRTPLKSPSVTKVMMHSESSLPNSMGSTPSAMAHPPHVHAIFNATRVLANEMPSSILINRAQSSSPLVSQLALQLVKHARDEGLDIASTRTLRATSPINSEPNPLLANFLANAAFISPGTSPGASASESLGKALASSSSASVSREHEQRTVKGKLPLSVSRLANPAGLTIPKLNKAPRMGVIRSGSSTPSSVKNTNGAEPSGSSDQPSDALGAPVSQLARPSGTLELESIIPQISQPPALLLAKSHGSSLSSPNFRPTLPYAHATAMKFASKEQPLTDRYGFIYVSGCPLPHHSVYDRHSSLINRMLVSMT